MLPQPRFMRLLVITTSLAALVSMIAVMIFISNRMQDRLPYCWPLSSIKLAAGKVHGWHAYDGSWQVEKGIIANYTEARGAKLMSGSLTWTNYSLDADIELSANTGDAGLMIRSSDEEHGVDSYSGYYAGLRAPDSSLIIGRADYGWMEHDSTRIASRLLPFHWYHLRLVAVGCSVAAQVTDPSTGQSESVSMQEEPPHCSASGRIGLRSTSVGAGWRNIHVATATRSDLAALSPAPSGIGGAQRPRDLRQLMATYRYLVSPPVTAQQFSGASALRQPIGNLRFASASRRRTVLIYGQVELLHPVLFVQDATGGASIPGATTPPLRLGDEVEVEGTADPHPYSSSILHGKVSLRWPGVPSPPLSISVLAAATGAYDGRLVEVRARLVSTQQTSPTRQVLTLSSGEQRFYAILANDNAFAVLSRHKPGSTLSVSGVCSHNLSYTNRHVPFVILLRTADDVQTIGGPPLWTKRNGVIFSTALVFLFLICYLVFVRVRQWQFQAILEERERLAHDLHDTLAQSFAGIGLQLRAIRRKLPEEMPALCQQIDDTAELVRHGHQEARRSISSLRLKSTDQVELLPALKQAASRIISDGSIHVYTGRSGPERPLPIEVIDVLFRVGQEAIANTVRHSGASAISIRLEYRGATVSLVVDDDGAGMNAPDTECESLGLSGVRRRVASVGGTVSICSLPLRGTRLHAAIPIPHRRSKFTIPYLTWIKVAEGVFKNDKG